MQLQKLREELKQLRLQLKEAKHSNKEEAKQGVCSAMPLQRADAVASLGAASRLQLECNVFPEHPQEMAVQTEGRAWHQWQVEAAKRQTRKIYLPKKIDGFEVLFEVKAGLRMN